jgi:hypothetical protein
MAPSPQTVMVPPVRVSISPSVRVLPRRPRIVPRVIAAITGSCRVDLLGPELKFLGLNGGKTIGPSTH